jgi:hypothetical protein
VKVSVRDEVGLVNLLSQKVADSHFQASLRYFSNSTVFVVDAEEFNLLNSNSTELSDRSKYRFDAWLNGIRPTLAFGSENDEFEMALQPSTTEDFVIDLMVENPDYIALKNLHTNPIYVGETRSEIFQRKLGYLLPFTKKVIYLDQFFHEQLLQQREISGAWYFLENLLKKGVSEVEIQTTATFPKTYKDTFKRENGRPFRDHTATKRDFELAFDEQQLKSDLLELKNQVGVNADITIKVFRKGFGGIPHDRFGMLKSNADCPIYFYIGPGMNIFRYSNTKDVLSTMGEIVVSEPIDISQVGRNLVSFANIKA